MARDITLKNDKTITYVFPRKPTKFEIEGEKVIIESVFDEAKNFSFSLFGDFVCNVEDSSLQCSTKIPT